MPKPTPNLNPIPSTSEGSRQEMERNRRQSPPVSFISSFTVAIQKGVVADDKFLCTVCEKPAPVHYFLEDEKRYNKRRIKMCETLWERVTEGEEKPRDFPETGFRLCRPCEVNGFELLKEKELREASFKRTNRITKEIVQRMKIRKQEPEKTFKEVLHSAVMSSLTAKRSRKTVKSKLTSTKNTKPGSAKRLSQHKKETAKPMKKGAASRKDVPSQSLVKGHKQHRRVKTETDERYRCACGEVYSSKPGLFQHIRRFNGKAKFTCCICKDPFMVELVLKRHQKICKGIHGKE